MSQMLELWFASHGARLLIVLATGSTMILVVAAFASQYLTRISAANRNAIWQIAILALGLLPLGWLCLPEIPLGLFANKSTPPIQVGENNASTFPLHRPECAIATFSSIEKPTTHQSGQSTSPLSNLESATTRTSKNLPAAVIRSTTLERMSASDLTMLVWLGVAMIFLARVFINYLRTALATRMVMTAKPANKSKRIELPPHVSLCYWDQLKIPIAVGILRKRIILPMEAEHWCADQTRMVIKHELAHIERNDVFWQLTISVFKSIYWFQPLLWWAAQESALAREQACDDRVLASGEDKADYATALVQLAASISGRTIFLSGALSMSEKPIERRLQTILSNDTSRSRTSRWLACFAASVALLIVTSVCSLRPFQPLPMAAQEADSSPRETSSKQEDANVVTHLRQKRPEFYKLNAKDVLGIFIEGILGDFSTAPPVNFVGAEDMPPAIGYPVPVREDGTLSLPLIKPIPVRGLTVQQAEALIERAYRDGPEPILKEDGRIIVTLFRERTYRVFVVRQDTLEQDRFVLHLPAYKNDVLNALMKTGGLPGLNASPKVSVLHTDNTQPNLIRDFQIAEFYKTHSPQDFPADAIPTVEKAIGTLQIPTRIKPSNEIKFKANDIILQEGDVVYVNSKQEDKDVIR